jgi:phosphatidylserine decarboxylase
VNFAREGYVFMGVAIVVAAVLLATALARRSWALWVAAFICVLVALWVAYFFRDPDRQGDRGDRLVVSPADGRVAMIATVEEPLYLHASACRISIFMNVFDVHVNRYPVGGVIGYMHYNPGKFLNAADEKASLANEQQSVGIAMPAGGQRLVVRQIAGLIARRIVTYGAVGEAVAQGTRMGMIRFGSRVDVFIALEAAIKVRVGQRVQAGVTVLAELPA